MNKKLIIIPLLLAVLFLGVQSTHADTHTQKLPQPNNTVVEIQTNGNTSVRNAKVTSISGSTVTATTIWNGFTITWTVITNEKTDTQAHFGGNANLSQFSVGDSIAFRGAITGTSGTGPVVTATSLTNNSNTKRTATFLGAVTSIDSGARSFTLNTEKRGTQKVFVSSSTRFIGKLNSFSSLVIGSKVQVSGLWDSAQNRVDTNHVLVLKNPKTEEKVFEGIVKSTNTTNTPNSIVLTIQNVDKTVTLTADASILNFEWQKVALTAFRVGDHVRIYGIGEDATIGATVVRDISLK